MNQKFGDQKFEDSNLMNQHWASASNPVSEAENWSCWRISK